MAFRVGLVLFAALFLHAAADELPTIYDTEKTSCLMYQGNGCNQIHDQNQCINSRDGRFFDLLQGGKVRGEPCVWCAGDNCTSVGNKCEPLGWLQAFPGFTLFMNHTVAGCWDERTIADTVDNARRELPTTEKMAFQPVDGGTGRVCRGAHNMNNGTGELGGINGGREWAYSMWTATSLDECMSLCGPSCTGVEFHEEDRYCEVWFDTISFADEKEGYQCYNKEMRCLTKQTTGCSDITDKDVCLSSRDGRKNTTYKDTDIYGQPCVWCGGGACTSSNANLCEPLDFLVKGEGTAFINSDAKYHMEIATCSTDTEVGLPLPPQSWVLMPPPAMPSLAPTEAPAALLAPGAPGAPNIPEAPPGDDDLPEVPDLDDTMTTAAPEAPAVAKDLSTVAPAAGTTAPETPADDDDDAGAPSLGVGPGMSADPISTVPGVPPAVTVPPLPALPPMPTVPAPTLVTPDLTFSTPTGDSQPARDATTAAPTLISDSPEYDNTFISDDRGLYFVMDGEKHPVNDTEACAPCGCEGKITNVSMTKVDVMLAGSAFNCSMVSGYEKEAAGGMPGFGWILIILALLCVAGLAAYFCMSPKKGAKKGKGKRSKRNIDPTMVESRDMEASMPLVSQKGAGSPTQTFAASVQSVQMVQPVPVPAGLSVTGTRGAYTPMAFGEGARPFYDAPTSLINVPHILFSTQLFQGPKMHAAGDQVQLSGPPGTMAHVLVSNANDPTAQATMKEALAGWDYFDAPMVADGVQGFRIYVKQIQQAMVIVLRCPVSFSIALSQTPVQAQQSFATVQAPAVQMRSLPGVYAAAPQVAASPQLSVFDQIDRNHDGAITQQEWRQYAFDALDRNHDGTISRQEWRGAA